MSDKSLTRSNLPWVIVIFLLGFITGIVLIVMRRQSQPIPIVITPPPPSATFQPTETPGPIRVYISGAVINPAVYELSPGAILEEAIAIAGGFSNEADPSAVNLALILRDGMHVHIPVPGASPVVTTGDSNVSMPEGTVNELININTATLEELDTLPGVGPATAQKIIDYRLANGPFDSIEDLDLVSGIGPAKLENIRSYITVQ